MFEPLGNIISEKADSLASVLSEVISHLSTIAQNTETEIDRDAIRLVSGNENTGNTKTATVVLTPLVGRSWRLIQATVTAGEEPEKGRCAVYLNAITPENFIDFFNPASIAAHRATYHVPEDSKLLFHFYEQPEHTVCTAVIQVEELEQPAAKDSHTGRSGEHVIPQRTPPIPSGAPETVPQIPAHMMNGGEGE